MPLGLEAVREALAAEVDRLAGARAQRAGGRPGVVRWSRRRRGEVALATCEQLRGPRARDAGLFRKGRQGLRCRRDAACAEAVPEAFGLSAATVSRRFIQARARRLEALQTRRLNDRGFVALVLDGRLFTVDRRRTSDRQRRRVATALLELEPRRRRIKGCTSRPQLRAALTTAVVAATVSPTAEVA